MQHHYTPARRTNRFVTGRTHGFLPAVLSGMVAGERRAHQRGEPVAQLSLQSLGGRRSFRRRHSTDDGAVVEQSLAPATP